MQKPTLIELVGTVIYVTLIAGSRDFHSFVIIIDNVSFKVVQLTFIICFNRPTLLLHLIGCVFR